MKTETSVVDLIGQDAVDRLRLAGFAIVPFDVPDYAVGEVMTWTNCKDPNMVWEGINCALNLMVDDPPRDRELLGQLGSGELTLDAWRAAVRTKVL